MELDVKKREGVGKSASRVLRRDGLVPAMLYGKGNNIPLVVESKKLMKFLATGGRDALIFKLNIEDEKDLDRKVMIKEVQAHPVRNNIIHVDFMEISMDKRLHVKVPIKIIGTAKGTKAGGILNNPLREVKIECLPSNLPNEISVNVSDMEIGDAIHIKELKIVDGVKILDNPNLVVVSVIVPQETKTVETEVTPEAAEIETEIKAKTEGKKAEN